MEKIITSSGKAQVSFPFLMRITQTKVRIYFMNDRLIPAQLSEPV
jgi:hypothetical protein